MRLRLIRIGNSRGIRIPKLLVERFGLGDVVDLDVTPEGLVIAPCRKPRHGWKQSFAAARPAANEMLLDQFPPNLFDDEDWTWRRELGTRN